jgi:hypothetical protein
MEYQQEEEEDKREIIKDQGSQASRALITMRRSRAEGANNLKVYNVQDYFVINRCTLKVRQQRLICMTNNIKTLLVLHHTYFEWKSFCQSVCDLFNFTRW